MVCVANQESVSVAHRCLQRKHKKRELALTLVKRSAYEVIAARASIGEKIEQIDARQSAPKCYKTS